MDFGAMAGKAKDLLGKNDDKVDQAMDKAGEFAKGKFAGHEGQIDGLVQKGKDYDFSGGGQRPPAEQPPVEQPPAEQPHAAQPPAQQPHAEQPPAQ